MQTDYTFQEFPRSRIASFDVYGAAIAKHHVSILLEFDVTEARKRLRDLKKQKIAISFNAWVIKALAMAVEKYPETAGFLYSKKKLILFDHLKFSVLVEKELNGKKVPIPLVIDRVNEKSAQEITAEIEEAKKKVLSEDDIVLDRKTRSWENLYYRMPAFLRKAVWRYFLKHPRQAYKTMGNVAVTFPGMMGRINGWFIHRSVHPLSAGIGSVIEKPVVVGDEINIREVLNMTLLLDHDAVDGAPMARFLKYLTGLLEEDSSSSKLRVKTEE